MEISLAHIALCVTIWCVVAISQDNTRVQAYPVGFSPNRACRGKPL